MAVHTIRLRAPWNRRREDDRDLWQRAFGRPTNLSEDETVRLVLHCESAGTLVVLNDVVLGTAGSGNERDAFDVTERLEVRNKLTLSMLHDEHVDRESCRPPADVWLEIEVT
ncbi:MAG: hypothetical protein GXX96_32145 [Planctomycetaceae bacterium]|nr:hypothetical protein [Planctomycetaceae bacterium]